MVDEYDAHRLLASFLGTEGDDCAVIERDSKSLLLTTDMLHDTTDFPEGIRPYVVGWRSMAVSLSDVAAMGGDPVAAVLALGVPEFDGDYVEEVARGARDVCGNCGAEYVGGDLDTHDETTTVSTVLGESSDPVRRSGASAGDLVCVTGELGRTAVALRLFDEEEYGRANELFAFEPRVGTGTKLSGYASSMMDISDGLALSLHQMSRVSDVGFDIESSSLPAVEGAHGVEDTVFTGGDYELVFTVPDENVDKLRDVVGDVGFTVVGESTEDGEVRIDGKELDRRGYEH
ncbi:MAG: thiamine-phosphate kinase [Halobacteria archaeon]|nr:thiamine-phosphate kinase [Halobacteria archaeon]